MSNIKPLIELKNLNFDYLVNKEMRKGNSEIQIHYDNEMDILDIKLIKIDTLTVIHFLDDIFGLVYDPETMQIIGLHIEDFRSSFIKKNPEFGKIWYLTDPCEVGSSIWDLQTSFQTKSIDLSAELFQFSQKRIKIPA